MNRRSGRSGRRAAASILGATLALLLLAGDRSPPPAFAHPFDAPHGGRRGRGMGPPWSGDGRCPAGGEMPVVPFPEAELPDAGSPGAVAFARFCAQCHALPDPSRHTAAEWPDVLERMIENMERMGVPPPESAARSEILAFLRAHAAE